MLRFSNLQRYVVLQYQRYQDATQDELCTYKYLSILGSGFLISSFPLAVPLKGSKNHHGEYSICCKIWKNNKMLFSQSLLKFFPDQKYDYKQLSICFYIHTYDIIDPTRCWAMRALVPEINSFFWRYVVIQYKIYCNDTCIITRWETNLNFPGNENEIQFFIVELLQNIIHGQTS